MRHPPARLLLVGALVALGLAGCSATPRRPARPLPSDSRRVLERALRQARPAFATQEEALRSGVYGVARPRPDPGCAEPLGRTPPPPAVPPAAPRTAERFVIQIAAFRERASAEALRADAQRNFPQRTARIEEDGPILRVILSGWESADAAEREIAGIRAIHPSAWIRRRTVP